MADEKIVLVDETDSMSKEIDYERIASDLKWMYDNKRGIGANDPFSRLIDGSDAITQLLKQRDDARRQIIADVGILENKIHKLIEEAASDQMEQLSADKDMLERKLKEAREGWDAAIDLIDKIKDMLI
jgi:hypothetical protein